MADLTAIILVKNEEKNIEKCIRSIENVANRVLVVDSGSTDKTLEIAERLGAEVMVHELDPFIHAKQFRYAMENGDIQTQWVMRIDADEELTKESAEEVNQLCEENQNTDVNGIILRFEVRFMGKSLRHGGIYPFRKLLVFKYGKGNTEMRNMDEHIVLWEGRAVNAKYDSLHHDYKDLSYWIQKHNSYSSKEVQDYFEYAQSDKAVQSGDLGRAAGIKRFIKYHIYYHLPMGMRAWVYYFYRYYLCLGFLDGREGKIYAFLQAYWYRFLVDAKIYEQKKGSGIQKEKS